MNTPHPANPCNPKRITQFLNSDHYHLDDVDLIEHLELCESCRRNLLEQSGGDEAISNARVFLQLDNLDQEFTKHHATSSLEEPASETSPNVLKIIRDLLVPSEFPNHLGRLGSYEITGIIGAGGMGIVLKAIDPSLDRVVAVKLLNPRLAHSENARKRFAREAKAAAAILHPNVIPIHSVSSGSTVPYLVMSYVRGSSLQNRLQREGKLPLLDVLRIGSQIAAGLQAAHERGLVHRDIKPENILLEEGVERVTITDFGLARAVDDNSVTLYGSIAGTPQYMSPEQAKGEAIDHRSDLFSLGSVLYALCAGRPPFSDISSYGVMRRIIDDQPVRLRELNPAIPEWLVMIINRLMAKDREQRFATAGEVQRLLDACITHLQHPKSAPLPDISGCKTKSRHKRFLFSRRGAFAMIPLSTLLICGTLWTIGWLPDPPFTSEPAFQLSADASSDTKIMGSGQSPSGSLWNVQTAPQSYVELQLHWIQEGQATVLQEFVIETEQTAGKLDINLQLRPNKSNLPNNETRTPFPSLAVSGAGVAIQESDIDFPLKALSLLEQNPKSYANNRADHPLPPGNTHLFYVGGYNTSDTRETQSLPKMKKLSQEGAIFVVVTFRWFREVLQEPADLEKAQNDRTALKGKWEVVRSVPPSPSDDSAKKTIYHFEDDQVSVSSGGQLQTMTYRLTPIAIPKILDIDREDLSYPCIYELSGDSLKIRFPNRSLECPQSFEINDHSLFSSFLQVKDSRYLELKRVE